MKGVPKECKSQQPAVSSGLWDTAVKPKTHRITKQITAKGHQNAAATWHPSQCCVNDPAVVDKA